MAKSQSFVCPIALFISFFVVGTMARNACSATDVFTTWGGKWRVSLGGTGNWQVLNTSQVAVSDLRFGDFDGDGKTDVFTTWGGKWRVSFGGTSNWQIINSSAQPISALAFGDFDGDGKTDVFTTWGGKWRVSFGGTGGWQDLNTSSVGLSDLRFGDFNGNALDKDATTHVCLRIARFSRANLNNEEADRIVTSMSSVLQTKDGTDDVECLVKFTRAGVVTAFTPGDGSIDTQAEFNTVVGLPGHIKVVNQINWCSSLKPNIIGCAPTPGNSEVVVRFTANQEGILWAHEYGHTRGLPHRNDPNAVMNGTMGSTNWRINLNECTAFKK